MNLLTVSVTATYSSAWVVSLSPALEDRVLRRLAILCLACALGPAEAHVGDLFGGMDLILSGPAPSRGIDASVGLFWSNDGASYDFICHEAVLAPEAIVSPAYAANGAGVMLAVVPSPGVARELNEPVYRSLDGCTWDAVAGTTDQQIVALAFDPTHDDVAIAATGNLQRGATNRVLATSDAGLTWQPQGPSVDDGFFRGVVVSNAGVQWATSLRADNDFATVYHSVDGEDWVNQDVTLPVLDDGRIVFLDMLVASPTDPDTAWLVRGPIGGPDDVVRTTDGGETLEVVYTARGDITDGAITDDGAVWVIGLNGDIATAADGIVFGPPPDGTPSGAGIEARGDALVLATRDSLINGTIAVSIDDGQTWSEDPVLDLIDGAIDCPADTHAAQCAALWDQLMDDLAEPDDTGSPATDDTNTDEEPGCGGCSSAGHAGWPLLVLAAGLGGLRRRRR